MQNCSKPYKGHIERDVESISIENCFHSIVFFIMELANLEEKKMEMDQLKMEEQQREEGDDVTLLLSLPGQRMEKMKFKLGVTIAYVSLT